MSVFNLSKIDSYRSQGYRPVVVACLLAEKKVLMVYKKEHQLWQFPQGGIENKETLTQALVREMTEELGFDLSLSLKDSQFLGEETVKFKFGTYRSRELNLDNGQNICMLGKHYFIYAVPIELTNFAINNSEFSEHVWADYQKATQLAESIYQGGKKRITIKALKLLKESNFLE